MTVFELEAEPAPLAGAGAALQKALAQPAVLRATTRPADAGGATVSIGTPIGSQSAMLTTLRIALDPAEQAPEDGDREFSVDFMPHQLRPDRVQIVAEAALTVLRAQRSNEKPAVAAQAIRQALPPPAAAAAAPPPEPLALAAPTAPGLQAAPAPVPAAPLAPGSPAGVPAASPAALWPGAELLGSARRGRVRLLQPRVVTQWHSNACGYHVLHNAALLLQAAESQRRGEAPQESARAGLVDESAFWRHLFTSMRSLRGRLQGTEKDAMLRSCTLDKSHMQHILCDDPAFAERLVIAETATGGLPSAEELQRRLREAPGGVLAFALGAVTHWLAAVVAHTPSGPLILLADSQNKPLLTGTAAQQLADEAVDARFPDFVQKLRSEIPRYQEAPEEEIREVWEAGLPEWWKGKRKDPVYWRQRPVALRKQLQAMEISAVYSFVASLEEALTGSEMPTSSPEAAL